MIARKLKQIFRLGLIICVIFDLIWGPVAMAQENDFRRVLIPSEDLKHRDGEHFVTVIDNTVYLMTFNGYVEIEGERLRRATPVAEFGTAPPEMHDDSRGSSGDERDQGGSVKQGDGQDRKDHQDGKDRSGSSGRGGFGSSVGGTEAARKSWSTGQGHIAQGMAANRVRQSELTQQRARALATVAGKSQFLLMQSAQALEEALYLAQELGQTNEHGKQQKLRSVVDFSALQRNFSGEYFAQAEDAERSGDWAKYAENMSLSVITAKTEQDLTRLEGHVDRNGVLVGDFLAPNSLIPKGNAAQRAKFLRAANYLQVASKVSPWLLQSKFLLDLATSSTLLLTIAQTVPNVYSREFERLINMALFATEFLVGAASGTYMELKETAEGLYDVIIGSGQLAVDFFKDPVNTTRFVQAVLSQLYEHAGEIVAGMGKDLVEALAVETAGEAGELTGRVLGIVLTGVLLSKALASVKALTKLSGEMKAAIKIEARLHAQLGKKVAPDLRESIKSMPRNRSSVSIDSAENVLDSVEDLAIKPKHSGSLERFVEFADPKERSIAEYLENFGRKVEKNPREGLPGFGRQGDAIVDGINYEFKAMDPGGDSKTISNIVSKSVKNGGQARNIVIDTRGSGLSREEAQRGVFRALGANPDKLDNIAVIGEDFFIVRGARR